MSDLIPSPLIGGQFQEPKKILDSDVQKIVEDFEAHSGVCIVFRREQVPCGVEGCGGLHSDGGDYNLSHMEKHFIINLLTEQWGLNNCEQTEENE